MYHICKIRFVCMRNDIKKLFAIGALMLLACGATYAQKKTTADKIVDGTASAVKETGKQAKKVKGKAAKGIGSLTSSSSNKTVNRVGEELVDRIDRKQADIIGTWAYKEPAVYYAGGNLLKEAASLAAEKNVEKKLMGYYESLGFNSDSFRMNFDRSKMFRIVLNNKVVGKGRYFRDGTDVYLEFEGHEGLGKLDPYERENGIDMLMMPGRMMTLMKNIGCKTDKLEAIAELIKVLNGVEVGMHMEKVSQ